MYDIERARGEPVTDRGEGDALRRARAATPERRRRVRGDPEIHGGRPGHEGPPRRDERHVVPTPDEAAREVSDDRLRAAELWRALVDRRDERRDEGDAHRQASEVRDGM